MAPMTNSTYFPPLDRCLAGDERLVSWKVTYKALCDLDIAAENTALEEFIRSEEAIGILSKPLRDKISEPPTSQSKTALETKTAAIHVSPSENGHYNIEQLKADALWLSAEEKIEELSALRIAILEWQQMPASQLLHDVAEPRRVGGEGPLSGSNLSSSRLSSTFRPNISTNGAAAQQESFVSESARRKRIQELYLEERSHALMTSAVLAGLAETIAKGLAMAGPIARTWITEVAEQISKAQLSAHKNDLDDFVAAAILNLEHCMTGFSVDSENEAQRNASVLDAISTLRVMLVHVDALADMPGAPAVFKWFQLLSKFGYFEDLPTHTATQTSLLPIVQCLASLVSLALLKLPITLNHVDSVASPQKDAISYPRLNSKPYVEDVATMKEVNLILLDAANSGVRIISPAIFAWGLITALIRDYANLQRAGQDARLDSSDNERSSPHFSSRRGSTNVTSKLTELLSALEDPSLGELRDDPAGTVLLWANTQGQTSSIIKILSDAASTAFSAVVDFRVLACAKSSLLSLIQQGSQILEYTDELQASVISILAPTRALTGSTSGKNTVTTFEVTSMFLSDHDRLVPHILNMSRSRYPYELSPMLQIIEVLIRGQTRGDEATMLVDDVLDNLTSFTQSKEHGSDYDLYFDDDTENGITSNRDLPLFVTRRNRMLDPFDGKSALVGSSDARAHETLVVPAGTIGVVVSNTTQGMVVSWQYAHSGLQYLGALLSTYRRSSSLLDAFTQSIADAQVAADIITLLKTSTASAMLGVQDSANALHILGRASNSLERGEDIISVIAEIFEEEMQALIEKPGFEGSIEVLVSCVSFFEGLLGVSPDRVWSILSRSSLLGMNDSAGSMAGIVGGTEVSSGRYLFLDAASKLYSSLLKDAISGTVKRRSLTKASSGRFDSANQSPNSTPQKVVTSVLEAFTRVLVEVAQNMPSWKFYDLDERSTIARNTFRSFNDLVTSVHGIDGEVEVFKKLTAFLAPAAAILLDTMPMASSRSSPSDPLGYIFASGVQANDKAVCTQTRLLLVDQTKAAIVFADTLLKTIAAAEETVSTKMKTSGDRKSPGATKSRRLLSRLFRAVPDLAKLIAADRSYRICVANLLASMVRVGAQAEADPPSLLNKLGTEASKCFLALLSELDLPLADVELEVALWDMMSAVVSSKQQWFAIYLITGTVPKDRLNDTKSATRSRSKPLLIHALDQLASIRDLSPRRACAMLRFIKFAQSSWVWAIKDIGAHPDFIKKCMDWLGDLSPVTRSTDMDASTRGAYEYQMAAHFASILAVNVHHARQAGDLGIVKDLVPQLQFLRDFGVNVDAHNRSLQTNLSDNLTKRFPSCTLSMLKRTSVNEVKFGRGYYYDLDLATAMFGHDTAWNGANKSKAQGFATEIERSSVNLALVDSQIALLKGWKALAGELSACMESNLTLQGELAKVAGACLNANMQSNLPEPQGGYIDQLRSELAFILTQQLVAVRSSDDAVKALFPTSWNTIRTCGEDFDVSQSRSGIEYYRTLLRVSFLAVQPHRYSPSSQARKPPSATNGSSSPLAPAIVTAIVEVIGKVVCSGFRALCENLHGGSGATDPSDVALLTALLQAILSIPGLESIHHSIAATIADSSATRNALSLYSWADQLSVTENPDPLYGELSILFLLEMSSVAAVAEQMAADGILTQLSAANLSQYYRKPGGKGPFDEPTRMFSIWSKGILPLCLNILGAVGAPIASEVSAFLNSFPEQLKRSEIALANSAPTLKYPRGDAITLGLVSEAHHLAFISQILSESTALGAADGVNAAEIPELAWNRVAVKEDIEALSKGRRGIKGRIVPVSEKEAEWNSTVVQGCCDNRLQEKIIYELRSALQCLEGPAQSRL